MTKRFLKRLLGMVLIVTLAFSFSACSGDEADMANDKTNEGIQSVEDVNEYVYVPETFPLEGLEYVNAACQSKDGLYLISPYFDDATLTAGMQGYYLDASGELTKLALRTENGEDIGNNVESIGVLSDGSLVYIESEQTIAARMSSRKGNVFFWFMLRQRRDRKSPVRILQNS